MSPCLTGSEPTHTFVLNCLLRIYMNHSVQTKRTQKKIAIARGNFVRVCPACHYFITHFQKFRFFFEGCYSYLAFLFHYYTDFNAVACLLDFFRQLPCYGVLFCSIFHLFYAIPHSLRQRIREWACCDCWAKAPIRCVYAMCNRWTQWPRVTVAQWQWHRLGNHNKPYQNEIIKLSSINKHKDGTCLKLWVSIGWGSTHKIEMAICSVRQHVLFQYYLVSHTKFHTNMNKNTQYTSYANGGRVPLYIYFFSFFFFMLWAELLNH